MISPRALLLAACACSCLEPTTFRRAASATRSSTSAARNAFSSIVDGDRSFKVASFRPLRLAKVAMNVGDALEMKLYNLTISGIETGVLDRIEIRPDAPEWLVQLSTRALRMQLTYDIKGRILVVPIVGAGPGDITLEKPSFTYTCRHAHVERGGDRYISVVAPRLTYTTTRMTFRLSNLFNGDERLGASMNTFLNDNWQEVNGEIAPSIAEAINAVATAVVESYFDRVPARNIFRP